MLSAKHGRILGVKIVVKAEKAGQPLAQFEYQVETEDKPHTSQVSVPSQIGGQRIW
jgi:hypothetical protein